jgi:hypothetical protein
LTRGENMKSTDEARPVRASSSGKRISEQKREKPGEAEIAEQKKPPVCSKQNEPKKALPWRLLPTETADQKPNRRTVGIGRPQRPGGAGPGKKRTKRKSLRSGDNSNEKQRVQIRCKSQFFIEINKIIIETRSSPVSLPLLIIRMKI